MLRILDIGAGSIAKLSSAYDGIEITCADLKLVPAENMEQLSYADKSFDIVSCVNALDHTRDARAAIKEMIRVCSGLVYIDCALIQRTQSGGHHYWDATEDGTFISKDDEFNIKDFGFAIELINNGAARRYNHLHAKYNHSK
jgi:SAM-dependent methyltransferase